MTICLSRGDPNIIDAKGVWKNLSWSLIAEMLEFDIFRMCFPDNFIWEVVVPMTNKYIEGPNMTLQGLYVWLGCHFFMSGFEGIENNKMWWSENPIDMFEGAPFSLSEYMSGRSFQNIGAAICYTNIESPAFLDRFHDVRQMIEAFNCHYDGEYVLSWINCLDE